MKTKYINYIKEDLEMNGMYDVNKGITGEWWVSDRRAEIIAELRQLGCMMKLA